MILLLFCLLLFLGSMNLYAQEQAVLVPMGALGAFSETEKRIVFNRVQESLSLHYSLVSQERFEKAQEQAFDELEAEECTEDQCFALIQELLQVENLFVFNMTREKDYTQLSLTRVDFDGQRTVRTALCQDCNIEELNAKISGLVQSIAGSIVFSAPVIVPVTRERGSIFITSQPSGADIILDGKFLNEQSSILLKNIAVGRHTVILQKGDFERQYSFSVQANKITSLDLKLKIRSAQLLVSSKPFKADVFLDGKNIGTTPLQTKTTVGNHEVKLQLPGYIPQTRIIELNSNKHKEIVFFLKPFGTLKLTHLHPQTQITLDGKIFLVGGSETQHFPLIPGNHNIKIQRSGFPVQQQTLMILGGEITAVNAHIPAGNLALKRLKAGDQITINGHSFVRSRNEYQYYYQDLPPGIHSIQIKRSGFPVQKRVLKVADGGSYSVIAYFPKGKLLIPHVAIGDRITIDNRPPITLTTPSYLLDLPVGRHEVRIQRYGFKDQNKAFDIVDGGLKTLETTFVHTQRYLNYQAWNNKRWMIAGSATLAFLYMNDQIQKVQTANAEKRALEEKLIAANSNEEAAMYQGQVDAKFDEAKQKRQNAQAALVLTLGLAGWTAWVWMDEPPQPKTVGWNWLITPEQQVNLSYLKQW